MCPKRFNLHIPKQFRSRAFTLIELLVLIATCAVLAILLLPALAGTRMDAHLIQCQSHQRQLGNGFALFTCDRNDMFPPAGMSVSDYAGQLAWDTYIYRYIGGTASDKWLTKGFVPSENAVDVVWCPVDAPGRLNKTSWVWMGSPPSNATRTYAIVAASRPYHSQVPSGPNGTYSLPSISAADRMGVGIWWSSFPAVDWNAPSYETDVVKDPAGTIMLAELPNTIGTAGNIWPCFCEGPAGGGAWGVMYQLANVNPIDEYTGNAVSQGWTVYKAHGNRFNYLFHDGHVAPLSTEQTVGIGTTNVPKGMWTITLGD